MTLQHSSIPALLKFRDKQAITLSLDNAANHLYRPGASDSELEAMRIIDSINMDQWMTSEMEVQQ